MITISRTKKYDLLLPSVKQSQSTVNLPSNPLITTAYETMSNPAEISHYKEDDRHFKTRQDGCKTTIDYKKGNISFVLQFDNIDLFTDSECNNISKDKAPAIMLYMLSCMNNENKLKKDKNGKKSIRFSTQDLVDIGIYETKKAARVGFKNSWSRIQILRMNYTLTYRKKDKDTNAMITNTIDVLSDILSEDEIRKLSLSNSDINEPVLQNKRVAPSLFSDYTETVTSGNTYFTVYIEETVKMKYLLKDFMYLQPYFFRLSKTAQQLLFAINNLARINCSDIKSRGFITIRNETIRQRLSFPDASDRHAYRHKQKIENAIEEIEEAHRQYYNNSDFQLLPSGTTGTSVASYYNDGYLKVSIKNELAETYISVAKKKAQEIGKKERAKNKAIKENEAKKETSEQESENQ